MNLPRTFASSSFFVAVIDMLLRVSALQLDHAYPLQGNYSRVRLRCKRDVHFISNARYYLNGSLITADRVLGYVQGSVAVNYTITRDTEGAVRCESGDEVSDEVLLAGQPPDYKSQNRSRYSLLSPSNPNSVVLQCDVIPGRLRSLYSIRWFRLFVSESGRNGFQQQPQELVDPETFALRLSSQELLLRGERVAKYQCRVTVQHNPSLARDYYGRKIYLRTRVQAEITNATIHTSVFVGDPVTLNCTARGDNITFRWTFDEKMVNQGQCVDDLCVTVTPQTTHTTSQLTISELMEAGNHHVVCQVVQHLPTEFNVNAITISSAGVLTAAERPVRPEDDTPTTSGRVPAPPRVPEPPSSNDLGTTGLLNEEHITLIIGIVPATIIIVVLCVLAFLLMWGRSKMKKRRCGEKEGENKNLLHNKNDGDVDYPNSAEVRGGNTQTQSRGVDSPNSAEVGGGNAQTQSRRQQRRYQRQDSKALVPAKPTTLLKPNPCYERSVSCPAETTVRVSRRMERRLQRQATLEDSRVVVTESISLHLTRQVSIYSSQSARSPGSTQNTIASLQPPLHRLTSVPLVLSPLWTLKEEETPSTTVQESTTIVVDTTSSQQSVATSPSGPKAIMPPSLSPAVEQRNGKIAHAVTQ